MLRFVRRVFASLRGFVSRDLHFEHGQARAVLERHRKQIDEESFERLTAFLDAVKVIEVVPDPDEQVALVEQQNIDAGEAVLFSVTHQIKNSLLATGDKRSLESLAKADDKVCRRLCKKLAGKVVCFEQLLVKIIDSCGSYINDLRTRSGHLLVE